MKKINFFYLIIVIVIFAAGCATVPYTDRSQFLMIPESQEEKLGEDAWLELRKKERTDNNAMRRDALKRVGENIARVADKPDYKWEFQVFYNQVPNAFCLPGGKVGVYSGLFKYTANDAELAAVVGHEIGHAIARHGGERMSHGVVQQIGAAAVNITTEGNELLMQAYGVASNVGAMLPYSRQHEYEADHIGLMLMAKAGYNPRAALSFWKKFAELSKTGAFAEFFSTHPDGDNRIEELEKLLPQATALYSNAPTKRGMGQYYK